MLQRFLKDRTGATAIEYGLIVAVMMLALLGGVGVFADAMNGLFTNQAGILENSLNK